MKKTIKFFEAMPRIAFIALIAVIVFSMTAATCGGKKDSGGASSTGNGGGSSFSWPPNSILAKYAANGMPLPTGASVFYYREMSLPDGETLSIAFDSYTSATYTSINNWLTSHGWTVIMSGSLNSWQNEEARASATYAEHGSDGATFGFIHAK